MALLLHIFPQQFTDQLEEDFAKPLPDKQAELAESQQTPGDSSSNEASNEASSGDWEHMSVEVAMWNLSIKRLEDVITLNTLLQHRARLDGGQKATQPQTVTVRDIKTGNKGMFVFKSVC